MQSLYLILDRQRGDDLELYDGFLGLAPSPNATLYRSYIDVLLEKELIENRTIGFYESGRQDLALHFGKSSIQKLIQQGSLK